MELKEKLNILEVIHSADTFKYRIFAQDEPSLGPTHRIFSTKLSASVLQDICQRIDKVQPKNSPDKGGSDGQLKEIGALLYRSLLPAGLQQFLKTCGKHLLILTEEPEIPWELLYDGENFLGLKYSIGRCLMWNEEVPLRPQSRRHSLSFLIIANPADNLPDAEREAETLLKYLKAKNLNCTYLAGPQATSTEILLQLNSGNYDVVHYCGHIENGLCLAGGEKLGANEISKTSINAPLIFLNGCASAKHMLLENQVGNLASAFLATGAQAVIGTTRKVADSGARSFAENFYNSVLEGEALGETLRKSSQELYFKGDANFSWASFVMYGVPNIRLIDRNKPESRFPESLNLKKFDLRVQEIVGSAIELAQKSNSSISTIHLFLSMLRNPNSVIRKLLGAALEKTEDTFAKTVGSFSSKGAVQLEKSSEVKFSPNAAKILKIGEEISAAEKSDLIKETHLIKALGQLENNEANKILQRLGINLQVLIQGKGKEAEKRFSQQARLALYLAEGLARDCGNTTVGTPHLFAGICALADSATRSFLQSQNIDTEKLIEKINNALLVKSENPQRKNSEIADYSDNLKIVLGRAQELASSHGDMQIEERHLVLSILENAKFSTAKLLESLGVKVELLQKNFEKS